MKSKTENNKVVVIIGTTASGKTKLAVQLAKKFNGEIVSADSRQVYRGMDIGTGKDLEEYKIRNQKPASAKASAGRSEIRYHLIDVTSPKQQFTVGQWQEAAYVAINDILKRGKLPIVVGGTGLYVSALVEGYNFPKVNQRSEIRDQKLRKKLSRLSLVQLLVQLKKIDPKTYLVIDKQNRVRVQRALEIYYQTGLTKSAQVSKQKPPYEFLILGLTLPKDELKKKIQFRLKVRLEKQGMVSEIKKLHASGVSWKKLDSFGLEYRYVSQYLQGKLTENELFEQLNKAIVDFAKRQMTWFKRDKKIRWIKTAQAESLVKKFI